MRDLQQKAIESALICDWERAIDYNLAIIKENPTDIQALNRLAKAYMELGQKNQAKEAYQKVLELDKYNAVAHRNLEILPQKNATAQKIAEEDFIEKPGITKYTKLIKLANKDSIAELYCKQPLALKSQGKLVSVYTEKETKIGSLPDDLSFKIRKLSQKGYKYTACIKAVENKGVNIFIRETKRPKRYDEMPSFLTTTNHQRLKK